MIQKAYYTKWLLELTEKNEYKSDNLHMFSRWKNYCYIPTIKKNFKRIRYCVYCSQISTGFIKKKTLAKFPTPTITIFC